MIELPMTESSLSEYYRLIGKAADDDQQRWNVPVL